MNQTEMPIWWFAGQLLGTMSLANDEAASRIVREVMRRELDDLLTNWLIGVEVETEKGRVILCKRFKN